MSHLISISYTADRFAVTMFFLVTNTFFSEWLTYRKKIENGHVIHLMKHDNHFFF